MVLPRACADTGTRSRGEPEGSSRVRFCMRDADDTIVVSVLLAAVQQASEGCCQTEHPKKDVERQGRQFENGL